LKRKTGIDLDSLLNRYQHNSVVSEIEKNLSNVRKTLFSTDSLYLSDLYSSSNYDLESYSILENSIKNDGFLLPLIIVKGNDDSHYEIINGTKRYLFALKFQMADVPCVLAEISPVRKIAYIMENIIDEGGCPLTKTFCYSVLKEKYGYTEKRISEVSGISISQVRNLLRLSYLPPFIKEGMVKGIISYGEARSLISLPIEKQQEIYQEIIKGTLSVRDLEGMKRDYLGRKRKTSISIKGRKVIISFTDEEEAKKNYSKILREFSD